MTKQQIKKKWVKIFMSQGLFRKVAEYVFYKIEKDIKSGQVIKGERNKK
jgi:hypothetical protein